MEQKTNQNTYVKVKDSKGNINIWKIINEFLLDNQTIFQICSRTTCAFIEKEFCFYKRGSSLLSYKNADRTIDIHDSNIELETEKEYELWLEEQNKNINPFVKFENCDLGFGYLEDLSEEEKWEYLKRGDNHL